MRTSLQQAIRHTIRREEGEGVISTGIAVLIMALIGAAMWVAFSQVFEDTSTKVQDEVGTIGDGDGGGS